MHTGHSRPNRGLLKRDRIFLEWRKHDKALVTAQNNGVCSGFPKEKAESAEAVWPGQRRMNPKQNVAGQNFDEISTTTRQAAPKS